ncbi:MAG: hypothetical protein IPJ77_12025 [Planctomycetes bacterium]|nr:hypothetical protein [Planctomycetota bacterium]
MRRGSLLVALALALSACGESGATPPRLAANAAPDGASPSRARAAEPGPAHAPDATAHDTAAGERFAASPVETPDELRAELDRLRARVKGLEAELAHARDERLAREREWLEYTQSIARLGTIAELQSKRFQPAPDAGGAERAPATGEPQEPPPLAPPDPERVRAARERDEQIRTSLRALFVAEQIAGLELLECGRLQDGATGPVVLRMTDDYGRTVGTLAAERLHLEASVAARTVTLVLEDGYERRGGERLPFPLTNDAVEAGEPRPEPDAAAPVVPELRSGRRRIELPHVDPRPWIEAVPELFRPADREPLPDDGRWDLAAVRAGLNVLLRADAAGGTWRLVGLAGVQEGVLRDVQLDQLDREGQLEKKLFADRLVLRADEEGVRLELESGAVLRGDAKAPFLDGRYRIFLPSASVADWRAAGLPGLSEPPPRRER